MGMPPRLAVGDIAVDGLAGCFPGIEATVKVRDV